MGIAEKTWDGIATVIRMNDKIERMSATVRDQQVKIETLTERVIRLETALEIALAQSGGAGRPAPQPRKLPRRE